MKSITLLSSLSALPLLLLPACGPSVNSGSGGGGSDTGTTTDTTTTTGTGGGSDGVTVLMVDDYELDGVTGKRPQDLSNLVSVTAFVKDGTGYVPYPGKVFGDGHAEIPGVPVGPYVLERKFAASSPDFPGFTRYIATSERTLDLGHDQVGRADVQPLSQEADLRVKGALSSPWTDITTDPDGNILSYAYDHLDIYSREAGVYGYVSDAGIGTPPTNGDTSLDWLVDGYSSLLAQGWDAGIIDAAKGDKTLLVRQRNDLLYPNPADAPDVGWATATYDHVIDAQSSTSLTLEAGSEAQALGGFSVGGVDASFDFVYKKADAQLFSNVLGAPTETFLTYTLYVEPGKTVPSASASPYLTNLFLLGAGAPANPACYPDDTGSCDPVACANGCDDTLLPATLSDVSRTFADKNPFNPDATLTVGFAMQFARRVVNPGDGKTVRLLSAYTLAGKAESMSGKPLTPKMGLVQNPRVGGKACDFDDVLTGVGTGPTLAWDAPATGSPQYYVVTVRFEDNIMDAQGNLLVGSISVASFRTTDTEVTFPEGALQTGHYYSFRVSALQDGVPRDEASPERWKSFDAFSSLRSTGLVTP